MATWFTRGIIFRSFVFWGCATFLTSGTRGGELDIVGTGDGVDILRAIKDAFVKKHPEAVIKIPHSVGSGGGIRMVGQDQARLGRVAREIREKEKRYGLTWIQYAKVPVVFVVNKSVGLSSLTSKQILEVYSGKVENWSQLGGPDMKIRVVTREKGDSSLGSLLSSFPGFKDLKIKKKSKTTYSTPETFALIAQKPGTIGFGPLDVALASNVTVLKLGKLDPLDPNYPVANPLAFVFKPRNNQGLIKEFVDFAVSSAVRDVIRAVGGVSMPKSPRECEK